MNNAAVLSGRSICILTAYDVVRDGRVRKQARTLANAGASVTVVGHGSVDDVAALMNEPYSVQLFARENRVEPAMRRANEPGGLNAALTAVKSLGGRAVAALTPQAILHRYFFNPEMAAAVAASSPDVIHVHNDLTVPTGMEAVRQSGAFLVYDSREVFDGYYVNQRNAVMMQRLSDWCESQALASAAAVFAVSPLAAQHLSDRYGRRDIQVMLNSLPFQERSPEVAHQPVRLVIQSSIRELVSDHVAVQAMTFLKDIAVLTVQGRFQRSDYRQLMEGIIAENGLEETVVLSGEFDPFDSIELASHHDVGLSVHSPHGLNMQLTLTNRVFTYLNAGLAVAMPDVPANRNLPGYETYGILLDSSDPESVAVSLRSLLENPERISQMKAAALHAAPQFSWENQERVLIETYQRVLGIT